MNRRMIIAVAGLAVAAAGLSIIREHAGWRMDAVLHAVELVPPARLRLCECAPDSTFTFRREDGLRLAGSLYGRERGEVRPTILLLHGQTSLGSSLPMYRVLATHLAERGFLVLTIDFAGFGRSDDPYAAGVENPVSYAADVRAGLRVLRNIPEAEQRVALVGHSMGAFEAMEVGLSEPSVTAVAALGPPRRTAAILATAEGRDYHWDRVQRTYTAVYHRPLPADFTRERFLELKAQRNIDRFLPRWMMPGHVPLLLIDGASEPVEDLKYLRKYADRVVSRSAYVTIPNSDHYLNTGRAGDLLYYDRLAVSAAADIIADFINKASAVR